MTDKHCPNSPLLLQHRFLPDIITLHSLIQNLTNFKMSPHSPFQSLTSFILFSSFFHALSCFPACSFRSFFFSIQTAWTNCSGKVVNDVIKNVERHYLMGIGLRFQRVSTFPKEAQEPWKFLYNFNIKMFKIKCEMAVFEMLILWHALVKSMHSYLSHNHALHSAMHFHRTYRSFFSITINKNVEN